MSKAKTVCHVCAKSIKDDALPLTCPRCGASLTNPGDETVQKSARADHTAGKTVVHSGQLYMTNKRLLYIKDPGSGVVLSMFGLIGALILRSMLSKNNNVEFSIPLTELQYVKDAKVGLFGKALAISGRDGTVHTLKIRGQQDEWKEAFTRITVNRQ